MLIENQQNQQNSVNKKQLFNENNNVQENIINNFIDNDNKEEYKTSKRKINIPKKFIKYQTMPYDFIRSSYNSFSIQTPYNKKERDLIKKQNLNKYLSLKENENENNNNIEEIRKESFYSERPNISDNSSDDDSFDYEKKSSMILFKSQKWKNQHSKRKLSCISEKIEAPILPVRNIPKFRIFKGFKNFQASTDYK